MIAATDKIEMRIEQRSDASPSDRVRALADIIKHAWAPFTDDERIELLAEINRDRKLDATTVEKMLAATGRNISATAKNLGVSRLTLQRRMHEYGMAPGKAGRKFK